MTKQAQLETERTIMRKLSIDYAEDFYALNLDKDVLKYTGDLAFDSMEAAKIFLANYDQYEKYGVGRMAVIDKRNNKFIGWCGLKYSPEKDEYDIGFRFYKEYWNQGFATETAKKCLEFGFHNLALSVIVGRAMNANSASIKVLEKLGMSYKTTFDFNGREGLIYEITYSEYLANFFG
ncbi:GNAT family N-acetyltransferase [Peijinzhouia sedimentorum]